MKKIVKRRMKRIIVFIMAILTFVVLTYLLGMIGIVQPPAELPLFLIGLINIVVLCIVVCGGYLILWSAVNIYGYIMDEDKTKPTKTPTN